jgi:DNA (cytosine-5)-methyltransferase 1
MKAAYYNEIDPFAAQWLRNLISAGLIAPGDVDERSIEDVHPSDLKPYAQCHFFAGIGVWSYALRQAGWPDDKPVWTGSCPCQPFSSAGKRTGFADERHLWPAWFHLIEQCRPAIIFGEQVASKDGLAWLDLVQADLEVAGYASGAVDLCAAGVGAPHIRQRLWWVAERLGHHHHQRLEGHAGYGDGAPGRAITAGSIAEAGGAGGVVNADEQQRNGSRDAGPGRRAESAISGPTHGLADGERVRHAELQRGRNNDLACGENSERPRIGLEPGRAIDRPGPTNGFWRDADWLFCRDGKFRPVEPGTFPLAHGASARVGRLRSYGNAINAEAAKVFIEAAMDWLEYGDL